MLQKVMGELPDEEARYLLKRCVDSGLWIPNANDAEKVVGEQTDENGAEVVYEEVKDDH